MHQMILISIIFSLASVVATVSSIYSTLGIGTAYAQNGFESGFIPLPPPDEGAPSQEPVLPEAVPQQSPPNELGQPTQSQNYQAGYIFGSAIGTILSVGEGTSARSSGLAPDPTQTYQPPTQDYICQVLQDFAGTVSQNASSLICNQSQPQTSDFFQGFTNGYVTGYTYGFTTGYFLDEQFGSQTQPPAGQSPTQQLPPFEETFPEATQPPAGQSPTELE
jgi:hypothetical protein